QVSGPQIGLWIRMKAVGSATHRLLSQTPLRSEPLNVVCAAVGHARTDTVPPHVRVEAVHLMLGGSCPPLMDGTRPDKGVFLDDQTDVLEFATGRDEALRVAAELQLTTGDRAGVAFGALHQRAVQV